MTDPTVTQLLRLAARVQPDETDYLNLDVAARQISDWTHVPVIAEAHGLVPLLYRHLTQAGVSIPAETRQRLFGLAAMHRDANQVRFRELGLILDAFTGRGLSVLVLKGAALAHVLYASEELRPLGDIDVLVAPSQAAAAQAALADLGFSAPSSPTSRRLVSHHHLPAAIKRSHGHVVQVEIHTDGLSRDTRGSLSLPDVGRRQQAFAINDRQAHTLGHADMLFHLCKHTAERAALLRLMWVADVVGYAARFRDEIPWDDVAARYPFVLNALALLHLVTPLPAPLLAHVTPARRTDMPGIGEACRPLTEAVRWNRPVHEIARDVLWPPEWWMRFYYGVSDQDALAWYRWVIHPAQLTYWLTRRAAAYARWGARAASA